MFLPYADEPNPKGFKPWVTLALIAVNVAVYILITMPSSGQALVWAGDGTDEYLQFSLLHGLPSAQSAYDLIVFEHGFRMSSFQFDDMTTSIFLHGGLMHLFGNMLFLWIYGDNVEHRLGRMRFFGVYIIGGFVSCLVYGLLADDPSIPLVGASGAISTVLGAYWIWFPDNRIKFFGFFFPFFVGRFQISARWVLLFYVVVENLLPQLMGGASATAYGAHLGGFAFGVLVAFVFKPHEQTMIRA